MGQCQTLSGPGFVPVAWESQLPHGLSEEVPSGAYTSLLLICSWERNGVSPDRAWEPALECLPSGPGARPHVTALDSDRRSEGKIWRSGCGRSPEALLSKGPWG